MSNMRICLNCRGRSYWEILTDKSKHLPGTPADLDDANVDDTASVPPLPTGTAYRATLCCRYHGTKKL
ncbi:hypothetical protein N7535_009049 [Penicillium sp. DV-2018c]|nr:hypothetical protein N7535_009049 [Penicillium sp. DV-2018c]